MPQDEHGMQSAPTRVETKLCVRDLVFRNTPIIDYTPDDISIQAVHSAADSKHAVAVRVQQRPFFVQWAQPSMLPLSRYVSFVHHELEQLSYVRQQDIDTHITSILISL